MAAKPSLLQAVQHIVVLMLENRSFDHMLGFLYSASGNKSPLGQPFEGLTGSEFNVDDDGNEVPVFKIRKSMTNAYYMPGADPGEGYAATNSQLFDSTTAPSDPVAQNNGFVKDFEYTLGWETQQPSWGVLSGTVATNIMGMFTPEMLPVLSALARQYAVCDHWYASLPTETLPNRAFANAGTSQGHMDDKTKTFTSPSIFGQLSKSQVSWMIYGYDEPPLTRQNFPTRSARPTRTSASSPISRRPPRTARSRRTRSSSPAGTRPATASIRTMTSPSVSSSFTTSITRCATARGGTTRC